MRDNDPMTAAFDYGEARRVQLMKRRTWRSIACEETDEDHPACWRRTTDAGDWCEACRRRFPIYLDWRKDKEKERKALRRLQRTLQRAYEGRYGNEEIIEIDEVGKVSGPIPRGPIREP